MANIALLDQTRKSLRNARNIHPTTKHCQQDGFPDQIKAVYFIRRKKFLSPMSGRKTVEKFGYSRNALISNSNADPYESGEKKVVRNFNSKLFALYAIMNERNAAVDSECSSA